MSNFNEISDAGSNSNTTSKPSYANSTSATDSKSNTASTLSPKSSERDATVSVRNNYYSIYLLWLVSARELYALFFQVHKPDVSVRINGAGGVYMVQVIAELSPFADLKTANISCKLLPHRVSTILNLK